MRPAGLFPQQPQGFLEPVAQRQGFVVAQGLLQLRQPLLRDVLPAHQQQIAQSLDGPLHQPGGLAPQRPPQVIQFLVDQFDEVKTVEDHGRVRKMLGPRRPVGGTHGHRDRLNLGFGQPQRPPEAAQRVGSTAPGHPHDAAAVEGDPQGIELLLTSHIQFIDGQPPQFLEPGMTMGAFQMGFDDILNRVPREAGAGGQIGPRHQRVEVRDERFEPAGVVNVGGGKRGATSKRRPHSRHWHLGTSVIKKSGFKPIGTVCNSRKRRPLRRTSRLPQAGQST